MFLYMKFLYFRKEISETKCFIQTFLIRQETSLTSLYTFYFVSPYITGLYGKSDIILKENQGSCGIAIFQKGFPKKFSFFDIQDFQDMGVTDWKGGKNLSKYLTQIILSI